MDRFKTAALTTLRAVAVTIAVCAVLVIVFSLQQLGQWWMNWGILPRTFNTWRGFLFAPLLHGSWSHLVGNLSALVVLVPLCGSLYPRETIKALPIIWVTSFATVWLLGAPHSSHIGASGIIYGLMSFSVLLAVFHRSWKALVGCVVVALFFSTALWGLLPKQGVSLTAHLGGALGGALAAYLLRKPLRT